MISGINKLVRGVARGLGLVLVLGALAGSTYANDPVNPTPVPEIDPGSIGGALTLLTGGAMMLAGKSRKR
jgi:hypothetical protein